MKAAHKFSATCLAWGLLFYLFMGFFFKLVRMGFHNKHILGLHLSMHHKMRLPWFCYLHGDFAASHYFVWQRTVSFCISELSGAILILPIPSVVLSSYLPLVVIMPCLSFCFFHIPSKEVRLSVSGHEMLYDIKYGPLKKRIRILF